MSSDSWQKHDKHQAALSTKDCWINDSERPCPGPLMNNTTQSRWPQKSWRTKPPRTAYSRTNLSHQWVPLSRSQHHCPEHGGTEEHQRVSMKVEKHCGTMICFVPHHRCAKHRVTAPQDHQNGHWATRLVASKHHCTAVNNNGQSQTLVNNVRNQQCTKRNCFEQHWIIRQTSKYRERPQITTAPCLQTCTHPSRYGNHLAKQTRLLWAAVNNQPNKQVQWAPSNYDNSVPGDMQTSRQTWKSLSR